jgi:SAM-dependent MidA family methyltransferase
MDEKIRRQDRHPVSGHRRGNGPAHRNNETPLEPVIKKRILESPERWISYAEYIDLCLYHPEWGYYMTEGTKIGKEGDFYTVGSMHTVFAETMARWTSRLFARWGKPIVFCEMGAGTGRFARDFLEALQRAEPDMYDQTTYFILEKSPRLITRQQEMLDPYVERVSWLPSVPSVRSTAGVNANGEDKGEAGRYGGSSCLSTSFSSSVSSGLSSFEPALYTGVFFSNELVDAFPVHVVECFDGEWLEVGVTVEEQQADGRHGATTILREGYVPLEDQAVIEYLQRHHLYPQEGQRLEVPVAADQWAQTVSDWVGKGIWLTFDYGYTDRELFLPPHRQGDALTRRDAQRAGGHGPARRLHPGRSAVPDPQRRRAGLPLQRVDLISDRVRGPGRSRPAVGGADRRRR